MLKNVNHYYHKTIIYTVLMLMALPILATLVYSFSTKWGATILPDGFTFKWYIDLFGDFRFWSAFLRSAIVSVGALALGLVLLIPIILLACHSAPILLKYLNYIILIPFAIPPVVSSVGLLQIYSDSALNISGTAYILIGTYFTIIIPFIYRSITNSLSVVNVHDLVDAARLLGSSTFKAFILVVLPNIKKGILTAVFISLSVLLGEFVFANILVGTQYETLQVYLYSKRVASGHFTSALVITYFAFIFLFTVIASYIGTKNELRSSKKSV